MQVFSPVARSLAVCFLVAACLATGPAEVYPRAQTEPRLSVLFLYADDQRADTISAWGNPRISTPNLDRLATEGFSFRANYNFGSNSGAVCIPSRAMVHTGRTYLHTPNDMAGVATLPEVLGDAGYHTFITGKWHNGEESLLRSYREGASIMLGGMSDHLRVPLRDVTGNRVLSGERLGRRHSSEIFADAAIRFLDDYDSDDPFYAYVAFTAPHDPRQPPAEYAEPYYERLPALPENFLPQHPFDNGAMTIRDERLASWPRTEADVQDQLAEYYGLVTHLDVQVGRILNALADSPHAERTLIIYAADHGLAVGSHGLLGKQNLYEHSVRSPLIVSGPDIPAGETRAFTYLLDLVPTVAELTGVGMPHDVDGHSLRVLWEGADERVRDAVFLAYQDTMRALRDEQYKVIVYPQINHRQLFDLSRDPDETRDLSTDVEYRPVLDRMLTRLNLAQQSFGDTQRLEVDAPGPRDVDLSGQAREPDRWQPAWIVDKYFR